MGHLCEPLVHVYKNFDLKPLKPLKAPTYKLLFPKMVWFSPRPEETMGQYQPGGYHPVALGDVLKGGRYTIYHKLGRGLDATIWVAHDSKLDKWVSVKIKTAERTKYSRELEILRDLQKRSEGNDRDYIIQLLDDFLIQGPNGRHQALVFEMIGPAIDLDIEDMQMDDERLDAYDILDTSSQLLEALNFVHEAGHTHGDLNLRNLVRTSKHFSRLSLEALWEMLGDAEVVPPEEAGDPGDKKGAPKHIIRSASWNGWPLEEGEGFEDHQRLRLFGFEEVSVRKPMDTISISPYCSDTLWAAVADCVDYRADLWAAGLFMYLLIFTPSPSYRPPRDPIDRDEDLDWGAPELPWEWRSKWEGLGLEAAVHVQNGFTVHGPLMSPQRILRLRSDVHHPSLTKLIEGIKRLVRVLPWERVSTLQALTYVQAAKQEWDRHELGRTSKL